MKPFGAPRINRVFSISSVTCKSPKNERMPLSFWRQNGFIIFIARHEVPGAISSEEFFASGSFGLRCARDLRVSEGEAYSALQTRKTLFF
jgi:hypothetical protein